MELSGLDLDIADLKQIMNGVLRIWSVQTVNGVDLIGVQGVWQVRSVKFVIVLVCVSHKFAELWTWHSWPFCKLV